MEFLSRDQIISELQRNFQTYIDKYGIDNIGIFEEEGQYDRYYIGYTATKDGKTYHIHTPFVKNNLGDLAPIKNQWTVESDEPQKEDLSGYGSLDNAFREI